MKKNQLLIRFLFFFLIGGLILGCTKIQRTYLLKGKWRVDTMKINGGDQNMLESFFPDHLDGKGEMILQFSDAGVLKAEHYSYSAVDSVIYGTWSMPDYQTNVVKLGTLVDAVFAVEIVDPNNVILYSDSNYIAFYGVGYVTSVLEVSKVEN